MQIAKKVLCLGAVAAVAFAFSMPASADHAVKHGDKVKCYGVNKCKGKGACATAGSKCKGMNKCKGQGVKMMSAKRCAKKGGTTDKH